MFASPENLIKRRRSKGRGSSLYLQGPLGTQELLESNHLKFAVPNPFLCPSCSCIRLVPEDLPQQLDTLLLCGGGGDVVSCVRPAGMCVLVSADGMWHYQ